MISSYKKITRDLKKNIFSNIYFLMGEESYFIDKIVDHCETNFIDEKN